MIRISVEVCEGATTRRVQISAPSIGRALELAGDGSPGRTVRLLFPIDPEAFFVPEDPGRKQAA